MAKQVYTYIVVGIGMLILLGMAGLDVAGTDLLNWIGITDFQLTDDITITPFYIAISAIFAAAGVGGFVLGFISNRSVESFIVGGFAGALFTVFIPLFIMIMKLAANSGDWTGNLMFLLLFPYMVGFAIALVSYWRAAD